MTQLPTCQFNRPTYLKVEFEYVMLICGEIIKDVRALVVQLCLFLIISVWRPLEVFGGITRYF